MIPYMAENNPLALGKTMSRLYGPVWLTCMLFKDLFEKPTSKKLDLRLRTAMYYRWTKIARYALKKGASPDAAMVTHNPLLLETAKIGHLRYMNLLLNAGADVEKTGEYNVTALIAAAQEGQAAAVRLLLQRNADPLKRDSRGKTAHDYATENNYFHIASILIMAEENIAAAARCVPTSGGPLAESATPDFNARTTVKATTVSAPLAPRKTPSEPTALRFG